MANNTTPTANGTTVSRTQLVDGLNQDFNKEIRAVLQYLFQSAAVSGPHRAHLREFFLTEAKGELEHAAFLADAIFALGGTPEVQAPRINQATEVTAMLRANLEDERQAVRGYTERAKQAEDAGELGLKMHLEEMIADETGHAWELERLLRA